MSELSRLLGDVYGGISLEEPEDVQRPSALPAATPPGDDTPDWADEQTLDAAFAGWVPGPPQDAPEAEREPMAGASTSVPPAQPAPSPSAPASPATGPAEATGGATNERPGGDDGTWLFGLADPELDLPGGGDGEPAPAGPLGQPPEERSLTAAPQRASGLPWSRSMDDVLPARGGGFRLRLR